MSARDDMKALLPRGPILGGEVKRLLDTFRAEVLREAAAAVAKHAGTDLDSSAKMLRRMADEAGKATREGEPTQLAGQQVAGAVLDDVTDEPTQLVDFFQPGHTYSGDHGWKFRVDTVTTHPENGELTAIGWRFFHGEWEPYAYHQDDWEIHQLLGYADVTEARDAL